MRSLALQLSCYNGNVRSFYMGVQMMPTKTGDGIDNSNTQSTLNAGKKMIPMALDVLCGVSFFFACWAFIYFVDE